MATAQGHAPAELEARPSLMHTYLEPPQQEAVHTLATIDIDLRFLPAARDGSTDSDAALAHMRQRSENALLELQAAEGVLRTAVFEASDAVIPEDAEISEAIDIYGSSITSGTKNVQEHVDPALVELLNARACTAIIAEGERVLSNVGDSVEASLHALSRITAVASDAVQKASMGDAMSVRTKNIVEQQRDSFYESLITRYTEELRAGLREAAWPPPELQNPDYRGEKAENYSFATPTVQQAWYSLCSVQFAAAALELTPAPTAVGSGDAAPAAPGSSKYVPLLAVSILMEPIVLRFRFHFDTDRTTNRLDKPEWFLSSMLTLIQENSYLFEQAEDIWGNGGVVYELTRYRPSPYSRRHVSFNAPAELLHALIVPLRLKLLASTDLLGKQPALLAHNIFQCLAFDSDIRAMYPPAQQAMRLADEMLGDDTLFQRWLDGEREFAAQRFNDVIESPGAWSLIQPETLIEEGDTHLGEADATGQVTTRAAATLINILHGVTERYQPLDSLEQRSAFIIRVQHHMLLQFYDRLARHLDAFENMSSAFSRALPGEITSLSSGAGADIVRGVNGLRRVIKAYISSEYVHQQLIEMSESSFFLNMADEIHNLPSGALIRRMLYPSKEADIDSASLMATLHKGLQRGASAAATLRPLSRSNSTGPGRQDAGPEAESKEPISVWERYISRYADISARCKRGIERLVVSEVLDLLKPYFMRPWDSRSKDIAAEPVEKSLDVQENGDDGGSKSILVHDAPCKELVPALARLASLLTELVQTLPPTLLLPVYRQISSSLSSAVVYRVLLPDARVPQQFSPDQAHQFSVDVHNGWLHVIRELEGHDRIIARRKKNEPTGLGRRPERQWHELIDAAGSLTH